MLIDTHCHLDAAEFGDEVPRLREVARDVGVDTIVVPAVEVGNFAPVRALAGLRGGVRCTYALGIHPMYVGQARDEDLERLREALCAAADDPHLVAVGEIGLDHFVPGLDRERQERFFIAQLRLAREFALPVILHVRRAQDAVLKQLRRWRPVGGIAHAFNGSLQQAQAFVGLGFALGFGGAMTFERALQIRRLAAALPDEAHVLETDAPDIAPAWRHPARNEPAELARIAAVLADLRGEPLARTAQRTTANARRVLPRLAALAPAGDHGDHGGGSTRTSG